MATPNDMIYTWGDTVTLKRSISNIVSIIDPQDTPCISYFGMDAVQRFRIVDHPNGKVEWLEDTLRVREDTIAAGGVADGTTTDFPVTTPTLYKPGDVWTDEATGELIRVETADGTSPITVVRDYGGTSVGAGLAADAKLVYLYSARDEGAESDRTPRTVPTNPWNQSQIFHAEIRMSGSERNATTRYGIPDSYLFQLKKWIGGAGAGNGRQGRAGDLMIDLENTFFYGQRVVRDGATNMEGALGGVEFYMPAENKVDALGAAPSEDMLIDVVQASWERGAYPNVIIANATNKRLISSWYKDLVRTERSERTGGVVIDTVETEFGQLDIMLNRRCPKNKVYVCQREYIAYDPIRPWFVESLDKGGDYTKDEVVGEYTLVVQHGQAHSVIYNTA